MINNAYFIVNNDHVAEKLSRKYKETKNVENRKQDKDYNIIDLTVY